MLPRKQFVERYGICVNLSLTPTLSRWDPLGEEKTFEVERSTQTFRI
jgi:hypothetical protein